MNPESRGRTIFSSIRIRLTLWYAGVLAFLLVGFALVFYILIERAVRQLADDTIEDAATSLINTLGAGKMPGEERASSDAAIGETLADIRFQKIVFAVYDDRLNVLGMSPRLKSQGDADQQPFDISEDDIPLDKVRSAVENGEGFETISTPAEPEIRIFVKKEQFDRGPLLVAAIRPLTNQTQLLANVRIFIVAGIPFAILLSVIGGYLLARKSLSQVRRMSEKAAEITSTNLAERLPVGTASDEISDLANTFNAMLGRLEDAFGQQRRFMADASHELRTPLAVIRGESEVSLQKEGRKEADYRESLDVIRSEAARLSNIVEDLLMLARADSGSFKPGFTRFYLDEVVSESFRAIRTLAEKRDLRLREEIDGNLVFEGSEPLIRRLVMNLLDNAVKYAAEGGSVSVTCAGSDDEYLITVENTGVPIPESDQPHIFDRFHRSDKVRSYAAEAEVGSGAGLGLAIGMSIARIHLGELTLERSDARSTIFSVRLPKPRFS